MGGYVVVERRKEGAAMQSCARIQDYMSTYIIYIYHRETRHHNSTLFDAVNTASKKRTNLPHW